MAFSVEKEAFSEETEGAKRLAPKADHDDVEESVEACSLSVRALLTRYHLARENSRPTIAEGMSRVFDCFVK